MLGISSVIMMKGRGMIPSDPRKITSDKLMTGIQETSLKSHPDLLRYEYVAMTKRNIEVPILEITIKI